MPDNFSFIIPGQLAGMAKPGAGGNIRSDLAGLKRRGIDAIVTLCENGLDPQALEDCGFVSLHIPTPDFGCPVRDQVFEFLAFADRCIADGMAVAVHCAAGMGRTGLFLACYLIHRGWMPEQAVKMVRSARPGSIETQEQEDFVLQFEPDPGRGSAHGEGSA